MPTSTIGSSDSARTDGSGRGERGFTLVELAVVLFIVTLLLGGLMYTLSAQTEQRSRDQTRQRLEEARELLLTFALVNGRLPCPASATSNGDESPAGGGACTDYYTGFLPGRAIGAQGLDASGYALDAWGNRIRYAVSGAVPVNSQTPRICRPVNDTTPPVTPHFTVKANLKSNGVDCQPSDLLVCASASGITTSPPSCGAATPVTNQNVVATVVWSHGKNYTTVVPAGDEAVNNKHRLPSVQNNHAVFVWHELRPAGATAGEYDDMMVWIPAGLLYGRMVAAGVLP
jgi:prepilin-type N-terminal cleavage/methylation domain-containing protein